MLKLRDNDSRVDGFVSNVIQPIWDEVKATEADSLIGVTVKLAIWACSIPECWNDDGEQEVGAWAFNHAARLLGIPQLNIDGKALLDGESTNQRCADVREGVSF